MIYFVLISRQDPGVKIHGATVLPCALLATDVGPLRIIDLNIVLRVNDIVVVTQSIARPDCWSLIVLGGLVIGLRNSCGLKIVFAGNVTNLRYATVDVGKPSVVISVHYTII